MIETIPDATVRRYYRDDATARVRRLFAPAAGPAARNYGSFRGKGAFPPRNGAGARSRTGGGGTQWRGGPERVAAISTPRLAASSMVRGHRTALPAREALMLMAVLSHPWLLDRHAEELAELEFRHVDADRLRRAILDAAAGHTQAPVEASVLREAIAGAGLADVLAKVESAITHTSDWPARPQAAQDDVTAWWNHVITLHHKHRTLHRELKDAELALGTEPSEEHLQWLRDVQERLSALEGSEALIEDFGALSGRAVRSF
jgi:DNA primase